jgi:hypothetical protein
LNSSAQKLRLVILGNSEIENKTIDSLEYNPYHTNAKSIVDEVNSISTQLTKIGFIENEIIENERRNDSTFNYRFNLGKRVNFIHIYIDKKNDLDSLLLFDAKNDTIILPYQEIETFLKQTLKKLEKKGFALSKIAFPLSASPWYFPWSSPFAILVKICMNSSDVPPLVFPIYLEYP